MLLEVIFHVLIIGIFELKESELKFFHLKVVYLYVT